MIILQDCRFFGLHIYSLHQDQSVELVPNQTIFPTSTKNYSHDNKEHISSDLFHFDNRILLQSWLFRQFHTFL